MKLTHATGHAVRHFVEMVIAMVAGMILLGPIWPHVGHVELQCLIMATDMTVGMTAWMVYRRHPWRSIAAMDVTMFLPFIALFIPYWAGLISADAVFFGGHLLMLPAMVVVMLRGPGVYAADHAQHDKHSVPDRT